MLLVEYVYLERFKSARLGDTDDYRGLYQAYNLYECVERRLCKQPGHQLVRDRYRNNYSGAFLSVENMFKCLAELQSITTTILPILRASPWVCKYLPD